MVAHGAADRDHLTFAVVPLAEGVARGLTSLYRIDPSNGSIEVGGIVYARSLQRTPASTEATYLLARHLIDGLGYRRFEWKLDSCNEPSAAAARRLGFTYEGRHRQAIVYKGRNRDTDWFSIVDAEWPAIRARIEAWLDPANFDDDGRQRTALSAGRRGLTMDPRVSFITLAVADLDATRRFYVDGLGWTPDLEEPGEVLMFRVADKVVLSLWAESGFEAEVGPVRRGSGIVPDHPGPQPGDPGGGRRRPGRRPGGRRDRGLRRRRAGVGRLHRLLRRPRRLPLGDRVQPRPDRAGRAPGLSATMWDRRPGSRDACHTRVTGRRAAAYAPSMLQQILVRTGRAD